MKVRAEVLNPGDPDGTFYVHPDDVYNYCDEPSAWVVLEDDDKWVGSFPTKEAAVQYRGYVNKRATRSQ